ncbi:hypothetical protein T459_11305 [Capsicum annuum]|uniref:Protein kinase domain-containing protein n=1 Tax=Capsicum annuum TaxID=4072 RepID=A0A2G2ZLK4_CAPAN|nr:hypothetical protein T459_11305 [Capsicum annuum]
MVAHLSDFGISKLLGEDQGDLYTKTLATFGYITPGLSLCFADYLYIDYSSSIPHQRIITSLNELFDCREKPNEFEGDLSLKQWVSYSLPDAVMEVVDANLLTSTDDRLKKEIDFVA